MVSNRSTADFQGIEQAITRIEQTKAHFLIKIFKCTADGGRFRDSIVGRCQENGSRKKRSTPPS